MIRINNVSKTYGSGVKAVDSVTLEIPDGAIFGFLGPNGAGKTTLIKLITGIILPDKGTIEVDGTDILKNPVEAKKKIGFVPDDPNIFLRLKGLEYLNFMADMYDVPKSDRSQDIKVLAERFGMQNALGDQIQSYSHGMRQKIILMGALIHKPKVWILDEPMTGLEPKSSFELKEMMREHADKGNVVFFSTHVLEVAEKVCDMISVINKGKILFTGILDNMKKFAKTDASLEKMFLEMTNA
ncbi:MAG: ABC transporter ATP-binding protein [Clostridiaceae bacterium]|nr:ABC transporter ATP-binding protein [Clostridiaceae bacterium]